MILPQKKSLIILILIFLSLVLFNFFFFPKNILSWDVFGYYMYLPMNFIYDNWGLQDTNILRSILDQYHGSSTLYQAYQTKTGSWVMRYPMGMAILYSPFFLIGHLIGGFTSYAQDGYSLPYQIAILTAGIVYSAVGFYMLRKILLHYYTDVVSAVVLLAVYFGTNYFMHSSFHGTNAMSHNYLFALYTLIIWFTIKWHETFRLQYLVFLGVVCGITIVARPSEIVCLLIPLLWEIGTKFSLTGKLKVLLKMKKQMLFFFAILLIIAMPQLIYWKIISGEFFFNSYGDNEGEGFDFFRPHILEVLFSFRKGWLLYTPIMLFAIAGLFISLKRKKEYTFSILIFFFINLFIVSSWSCWWYAESFGQRSLIPSYALMALPLGAFLTHLSVVSRKWIRNSVRIIFGIFIILNLFQTYQFFHGVINPSRMTKAAYFAVFGKISLPPGMEKKLMVDRSLGLPLTMDSAEYSKTRDWIERFENVPVASKEFASSGIYSIKLDSINIYTPAIEKTYKEISIKDHVYLKISIKIYCGEEITTTSGSLVATFERNGLPYGYAAKDIEKLNIEPNKWIDISMIYLTPVIRNDTDKVKIYYWHRGKNSVFIDDLKVEVWEPKD